MTAPPMDPPGRCTCPALPPGHNDDECGLASYAARVRCRCGHLRSYHNPNTRLCTGTPVCACYRYEPKGEK